MRYTGGKGGCWRRLVSLMPRHRWYVEPFLGGGNLVENKAPAPGGSLGLDLDAGLIEVWRRRALPGLDVRHACAFAFLEELAAAPAPLAASGEAAGGTLVYLDPPYLHGTRRTPDLYRYELTDADHVRLLELARALPCAVMLSGFGSELYDRTLADWRRVEVPSVGRRGAILEVVWCNYPEPAVLHDGRWIGDGFRDRERMRKQRRRWSARFARLPFEERRAMLAALLDATPELGLQARDVSPAEPQAYRAAAPPWAAFESLRAPA